MSTETAERRTTALGVRHHQIGLLLAIGLPLVLTATVAFRLVTEPGYLLQVDTAFGPRAAPTPFSPYAPVALLQAAAVHLIGGSWTGKLFFAAVFWLSGAAPMLLLKDRPWWAQCSGGLLGSLNPWTYDRLIEGQWAVAAAGSLLFVWILAWQRMRANPGLASCVALALAVLAPAVLSEHFAGIVLVLAVLGLCFDRTWHDAPVWSWTLKAYALALVLGIYGLVGFFADGGSSGYAAVQHFGRADLVTFRSTPDGLFGLWPALLGLYGEWAERIGRFPVATTGQPLWLLAMVALVSLAILGAWRRRNLAYLLVAGLVGVVVSGATATTAGLAIVANLATRVPAIAAYREPQKWSALWMVALVVLGADGTVALSRVRLIRRYPELASFGALAMVAATMFPAGVTTLRAIPSIVRPVQFPQDWHKANEFLMARTRQDSVVVALPWHLYTVYPFVPRLVMNPATVYFPAHLITSTDVEIPGESSTAASPGNIGRAAADKSFDHWCSLADAVRRVRADFVVIEQTVDADVAALRLLDCGFRVVEGSLGETLVMVG